MMTGRVFRENLSPVVRDSTQDSFERVGRTGVIFYSHMFWSTKDVLGCTHSQILAQRPCRHAIGVSSAYFHQCRTSNRVP